jgi:hypothetical protein
MTESVFPFPGGKSLLAPWIIEHFPPHKCYVEVFGGGAAVLLTKNPDFDQEGCGEEDGENSEASECKEPAESDDEVNEEERAFCNRFR